MTKSSEESRSKGRRPARLIETLPPSVVRRPGRQVRAAVVASDYIRTLIFDGILRAGDQLPIDQIAEILEVSRQPVRDAVLELEHDGLVVAQAKSGTYVQPVDADLLREDAELHGRLHGYALRLIVAANYKPALDRLRAVDEAMANANSRDDLVTAANDYMYVLDQAGPYRRLRAVLHSMSRFIPPMYFVESVEGAVELIEETRTRVLQVAFGRGPYAADRAGDAQTAMWRQCGELLIAHLDAKGVLAADPEKLIC